MARETVLEARAGGVLRLTLNRPAQKNAFNTVQWREARDALRDARGDDSVRAVLVTGAGSAFSAGQDLSARWRSPRPRPPAPSGGHPFGEFMDELCQFDKPLVAAVNGVAVGIGLTLLLHCDFVYVAEGARLRAPFVTLGVVPEAASSYLLPLVIGWRAAQELLFGDGWLDAKRAAEIGLANAVCAPGELLAVADAKATRARGAPARSAAPHQAPAPRDPRRPGARRARGRGRRVPRARRLAGEPGSRARVLREARAGLHEARAGLRGQRGQR